MSARYRSEFTALYRDIQMTRNRSAIVARIDKRQDISNVLSGKWVGVLHFNIIDGLVHIDILIARCARLYCRHTRSVVTVISRRSRTNVVSRSRVGFFCGRKHFNRQKMRVPCNDACDLHFRIFRKTMQRTSAFTSLYRGDDLRLYPFSFARVIAFLDTCSS